MLELMKGIRSIFEASTAVNKGNKILVIADDDGNSTWLGQAIVNVINSMDAEAVQIVVPRRRHGKGEGAGEPPPVVAAAMKSVDVVFRVSGDNNWVHSDARKEAANAGVRYRIIGGVPLEDLERGVSAEDYQQIKQQTEKVATRLSEAKVARVTTQLGTNITMDLTSRGAEAHHPLGDVGGGLPYNAEAAIAPMEGSAEGVIVADLAIVQWQYRLRDPLRLTVKAGKVVDISGGAREDADRLRSMLARDENANNIAELGIGTSHVIPWPMHGTRRDAGRIGTAHIGIGRNSDIGGKTWSRIHQDALMSMVTVQLDSDYLFKEGALLF